MSTEDCWMKVGSFTGDMYCGKHGRSAGWPCMAATRRTEYAVRDRGVVTMDVTYVEEL